MKLSNIWPFRLPLHRAHAKLAQAGSEGSSDNVARLRLEDFEKMSADWLWETNGAGELVYLSRKLAAALACPMDQLLGRRLSDVSGLPGHLSRWQALQAGMD